MSKKSKATSVPVIIDALNRAEDFLKGFEDDNTQRGVKTTLKLIAKARRLAEESTDKIVIEVEGGNVAEVYTDLAQVEFMVYDRDQAKIGERVTDGFKSPEPLGLAPEDIRRHV